MANRLACAICGTVEEPAALPPNVQPVEFRNAVATFGLIMCIPCINTKTILDVIQHAESAGPGGTVEGDARIPYLVEP